MVVRLGVVALLAMSMSACEILEMPGEEVAMSPASTSTDPPAVNLTGQWEGEVCYRQGYGYFRGGGLCNAVTVVLQQEGSSLSGALKEPDSIPDEMRGNSMPKYDPSLLIFSTIEGTVHGLEVSWTKTYDGAIMSGTQKFDGKATENGTMVNGQWKLTRNFGSLNLKRVAGD